MKSLHTHTHTQCGKYFKRDEMLQQMEFVSIVSCVGLIAKQNQTVTSSPNLSLWKCALLSQGFLVDFIIHFLGIDEHDVPED